MITRHHVSLATGSALVLFFPLAFANPGVFAAAAVGVCAGVVIPDVQMKRPSRSNPRFLAWVFVQVFKRSVLRLYLSLLRGPFPGHANPDDKRLTHSIPGLVFVLGILLCGIVLVSGITALYTPFHLIKAFLGGCILGLILHLVADICTKKGLVPLYPFTEGYRICGSIRPCNKEDRRIRLFHVYTGVVIAICGLACLFPLPGYVKWLICGSAGISLVMVMIVHAEVRMEIPVSSPAPDTLMQ